MFCIPAMKLGDRQTIVEYTGVDPARVQIVLRASATYWTLVKNMKKIINFVEMHIVNSLKLLSPEALFKLKMHQKPFGGRAPPGPAGELTVLPRPSRWIKLWPLGGGEGRGGREGWSRGQMGRERVEEGEGGG